MSRIRSRDTTPERGLRRLLFSSGIRGYRLKYKLEGKPDLFFPRRQLAVFVDGCFWHKCKKCYVRPKSSNEYWDKKIDGNVARDKRNNRALRSQGIKVLRLWEHEVQRSPEKCLQKVVKALS